jgi:hypothetical protein
VTPCAFRQAASFVRVVEPLAAAEVEDDELELLPQAATARQARTVPNRLIDLLFTRFLSKWGGVSRRRRRES